MQFLLTDVLCLITVFANQRSETSFRGRQRSQRSLSFCKTVILKESSSVLSSSGNRKDTESGCGHPSPANQRVGVRVRNIDHNLCVIFSFFFHSCCEANQNHSVQHHFNCFV